MPSVLSTKTVLAKQLGIARSSLYYQPKKPPADAILKTKIMAVMAEHPAYGHRRIALALHLNKKPVCRIMRIHGLKPKLRRRSHPLKPDDQNRPATQAINILKLLCPIRPNVVWAGDFTYLWWMGRFWYVATVIDVYTREIVGWHIANHHTTALISEALNDAVRRTGTTPQWFHSDQGSEYVSGVYALLLQAHAVIPSHSTKASPWQNGYQESFYSNFKLELGNPQRFNQLGELIEAVHQQIFYYNHRRIHITLRMSPLEFKQNSIQQQVAYATTAVI
jgi:transposase InsO family protein